MGNEKTISRAQLQKRMEVYTRALPNYYLRHVESMCNDRDLNFLLAKVDDKQAIQRNRGLSTGQSGDYSMNAATQMRILMQESCFQRISKGQLNLRTEFDRELQRQKNLHMLMPTARVILSDDSEAKQKYRNALCCPLYSTKYDEFQAEQGKANKKLSN